MNFIKNTIAIASGKGGVGKSSTTVNIAYTLKQQGYRVGILDADLYGPSIPKMLNISIKPTINHSKKFEPVEKDDIQIMSMGLLVAENTPVIWRGPILQKAITQFLFDVNWKSLDFLLIDLPPGTGDIHLSIMRKAKINGAIIVSTPQDIALIDARKAIEMFKKLDITIIGLIENMSYFECPHCNQTSNIFSTNGVQKMADSLELKLIGKIPLMQQIREMTDSGEQKKLLSDIMINKIYKNITNYIVNNCQLKSKNQ